jgi:hypothetical protein
MLVARRDPPFHGNARDISPVDFDADPRPRSPRAVRFVTAIQMIGSLLALPVGIASAYTFYRANFSPETTCQSLRSGIIGMLDKGLDASTRRILVRRDVELQPTAHPIQRDAEPHVPPAIAPSVSATATAPAATASPVPAVAPTLPPPVSIAPAPAQQDVAQPKMPDHPIPPGSIPSSEAVAGTETKTDESGRSRIGKWISSIPLLGNVVDNGRH